MVTISKMPNGNIRVHIDCRLKSGAVRQFFVEKDEQGEEMLTDVDPFVKTLSKSFAWRELLTSGTYADKSALAAKLGICRQNLRQILHLPYLSPVIVEKVMNGELTNGSLMRCWSLANLPWYDQHKALGID